VFPPPHIGVVVQLGGQLALGGGSAEPLSAPPPLEVPPPLELLPVGVPEPEDDDVEPLDDVDPEPPLEPPPLPPSGGTPQAPPPELSLEQADAASASAAAVAMRIAVEDFITAPPGEERRRGVRMHRRETSVGGALQTLLRSKNLAATHGVLRSLRAFAVVK
jgi:hypothetical protein